MLLKEIKKKILKNLRIRNLKLRAVQTMLFFMFIFAPCLVAEKAEINKVLQIVMAVNNTILCIYIDKSIKSIYYEKINFNNRNFN